MRSRHLVFAVISLLSFYGCGGSSPGNRDAADGPVDTNKDTPSDNVADGAGGAGADAKDAPDLADAPKVDASTDSTDASGEVGGPPPCTVATECPGQDSECKHRTCTAGVCGTANEANGKVLATQVIGDCRVRQCAADGTVTTSIDDKDIPDDLNACTKDVCTAGVASHAPLAKDTACGGGKLCNATGQCVGCNTAADCPGADTFCGTRTCVQNTCGVTFKPEGTKLVDSQSGDCKIQQCDGKGVIQTVASATDLPVDNNPCTQDQCNGTTPTHQPVARNTTCGAGQVCDGASHCVTCLTATTCPGTDTMCQTRTCVSGSCGMSFVAAGTAVSGQVSGDCSKKQCNGTGMVVTVVDSTDPLVDNNPCTKDLCDNGQPSNPPLPARTNCGANLQCDGAGKCVTCLTTADCPGTDTECQSRTCTAGTCGIAFKAAGTPVSNQTAGDCKQNQCDGKGVVTTVVDDSDTQNDNNPCTDDLCSGGTSSHPNKASKVTCGTNLECDGAGHCVGCVADAECGTNTECVTFKCTSGTCVKTPTAAGTLVAAQTAKDCKKNQCDGAGNVATVVDDNDLPVDGFTCTKDVCMAGAPSNPALPLGTMCAQAGGTMCNGNGSCVQCITAADCGQNTECKTFTCVLGACGVMNTAANMPLAGQVAGDCQKKVCDGSGAPTSITDDSDKPADNNVCTDDICTNGTPTNPVVVDRTCNGNDFCKADGTCVACNSNIQCGADTECMKNTCVGNACVHTPQTGVALATQVPKNCRKETCDSNGAPLGSDPDDTDLPDDGNQCTQDLCNGGQIQHPFESTQKTCGTNGLCDGQGSCVGCNVDADCGVTNECESNTCDQGTKKCVKVFTPNHTATTAQAAGNCKKHVCNGSGQQVDDVDQSDVPIDGNVCTDDLCSADGTPSNPVLVDHACAANGVCKSDGTCVGCNTDAQCGANTECRTNTCVNNSCSIASSPVAGTALAAQTAGDCKTAVCDGLGGTTTSVNVMDVPVDNKACTADSCDMSGNASNPNLAAGAVCNEGGGRRCNGSGSCVAAFAVLRLGDGVASISSGIGAAAFIETRTEADGTLLGSELALSSGQSNAFSVSGSASSEGAVALSRDGHYITVAGYLAPPGTTGVASAGGIRRMAVRIDSASTVDTTSGLLPLTSGGVAPFALNNVRSAVTETGLNYWYGGAGSPNSTAGVWLNDNGTITQVLNNTNNVRWCQIYSTANSTATSQLYCSGAGSGFSSVIKIGSGLPTTTGQTAVNLTGLPTSTSSPSPSPFAFAFMDLVANDGISPDTLYVSDDRVPNGGTTAGVENCTGGGIQKWVSDAGGTWTCKGTFQANQLGTRGLTAMVVSGKVSLIFTNTAASPNAAGKCVDDLVTVPSMSTCATLVSSGSTLKAFRGVSLPPMP